MWDERNIQRFWHSVWVHCSIIVCYWIHVVFTFITSMNSFWRFFQLFRFLPGYSHNITTFFQHRLHIRSYINWKVVVAYDSPSVKQFNFLYITSMPKTATKNKCNKLMFTSLKICMVDTIFLVFQLNRYNATKLNDFL